MDKNDELQSAGSGSGLGIFLTDDLLTNPNLTLEAKIIYLFIRRDLETTGKKFTSKMTDSRLIQMTGFSESTVHRRVHELYKKGYISLVTITRARKRNKYGRGINIGSVRYIYLDKKLAGYRKRAINKTIKPVDAFYSFFVSEGKMTEDQYIKWQQLEKQKLRDAEEETELERSHHAFKERLGTLTDAEVTEYEDNTGVEPGSYAKLRLEQLELNRELAEMDKQGDDGLFD